MKTLRQVLGAYTEEQLEQIARWWGISNTPDGGWGINHALFVQAMQDQIAARFAWEHLSEDERKVLHNALYFSSPTGVIEDVLLKLTRLSESQFETALATLKQHLIVLDDEVRVKAAVTTKQKKATTELKTSLLVPREISDTLLVVGREIFEPNHDRSEMKLEKLLSSLDLNTLYSIGHLYGIVLNDYFSRSNPSSRLAGNMVQPELIAYAYEQFDATTRKLCIWLCEQGGKANFQAVREYTNLDDPALSAILHKLERYAIAFDTFSGSERVLFIPKELLKGLKKAISQIDVQPEVIPIGLVPLDSPPQSIRPGDTLLTYDIAVIIGAMYQQDIEPTKSNTVPKRITTKIQPLLHIRPRIAAYDMENFTVDMLYSVVQVLGLVQLSKETVQDIKAHYEPGPQLKQWSRLSILEQNQRLLEHWLSSHYWADIPGANYSPSFSYYLDTLTPRNAILGYLSQCTPGRWYTLKSLLNTIKAQEPLLIRSRQPSTGIVNYRISKDVMANWDKCDGEYITGILASSLHELGIVSLGYDQPYTPDAEKPSNPAAFMLTDIGAAILKKPAAAPQPASSDRSLIVQPNFELLLLHPNAPVLYSLLPFAQVNQIEVVSRLTLTRPSVLRGMATGKNIEQFLQLLEQQSQKEIPQNVAYTLRDWTKSYKEAKISHAVLIEVTSESLANEICASSKLQKFELRRLGPCVVAASSDANLSELRRALDKEGYVVRINGDTTTRQTAKTYAATYGRPR